MRSILAALTFSATSTIFAVVPNSFSTGSPAKAFEVNANFMALDTAIQNRATKLDLATKADLSLLGVFQSDLTVLEAGKAEKSSFDSLSKNVKGIRDSIGSKADTGKLGTVASQLDILQSKVDAQQSNFLPNSALTGPANMIAKFSSSNTLESSGLLDNGLDTLFVDRSILLGSANNRGNLVLFGGGPVGFEPQTVFQDAGVSRFIISYNKSTNSMQFKARNDDGSFQDIPLAIDRVGTGNVNISRNLIVSGTITAKTFTPTPDYVFEPSYKLPSLSEIAIYTTEHKHLPEIPSAAEIEKGGLDLAHMNLLLLKKVEELTLHAIAQQKLIEQQKEDFEARIQRLESALR